MLETDLIEALEPSANAENFSLESFFHSDGQTLMDRVSPFSNHLDELIATGRPLLYAREIVGPCKNRSRVRDLVTGEVREMIMLGSNNYLGLTTHPHVCDAVRNSVSEYGTGMGGPPLLNGMSSLHRKLERKLAQLKTRSSEPKSEPKSEYDAMLFGSGYQANVGWVRALLKSNDILLYDELSHASLFDGIAQAQVDGSGFKAFRFRHNRMDHLERLLQRTSRNRSGLIFVAVEGVYSMDGDIAPLPEVQKLCEVYGAILFVDDAHGTGVMGKHGAGTAEFFGLHGKVDLSMGTFSKTFGTTGGFIVAKREVIDYLRFFSRSYMFSAHLPPTTIATVLAGIEVMEQEPERIQQLHDNAAYLRQALSGLGFQVQSEAPIIPILIPPEFDIREISRRIHEKGVFLNSIEHPAVSKSEQRLRVSLMSTHTREDLDFVITVFRAIKEEFHL